MNVLHVAIRLPIAADQALKARSAPSSVQHNAEGQEVRDD